MLREDDDIERASALRVIDMRCIAQPCYRAAAPRMPPMLFAAPILRIRRFITPGDHLCADYIRAQHMRRCMRAAKACRVEAAYAASAPRLMPLTPYDGLRAYDDVYYTFTRATMMRRHYARDAP